jgi:hypothetical protein
VLYNPDWKKPESPKKAETWQDVIKGAIDLIQNEGWAKGTLYKENVGYCMMGAMVKTTFGDMEYTGSWFDSRLFDIAYNRLQKECKGGDRTIINFNDDSATTKEDVIHAMNAALKETTFERMIPEKIKTFFGVYGY